MEIGDHLHIPATLPSVPVGYEGGWTPEPSWRW